MDRRNFITTGAGVSALALAPGIAQAALNQKEAPMTSAPTTPEENKAIVKEWFRLYEVKKIDEHNAMIHPQAKAIYPEMQYFSPDASMGMEGLKKTLESDGQTFVDLHMRIDNMWGIDNTVFVEGFFIGSKLKGALKQMAKAEANKVPYLHRIEIQDRKIKFIHSYYDTALFYQIQLGLEGPTRENPMAPWMKALSAEAAARKAAKK